GVVKGEITNREEVEAAVRYALERVQQDVKAEATGIYLTLGGTRVQSMRSQGFMPIHPAGRAIKRQDVHQVIQHSRQFLLPAGKEQLMAVPTEFRVDQQRGIQRPLGMNASRLEVLTHIVTVDSATMHRAELLALGLGLELLGAVPEPLASALGVATRESVEGGTIVADIGGTVTNIAVLQDGHLVLLAGVPVGSRHITTDLAQLLKLELRDAEKLKVEQGYAVAGGVNAKELVPLRVEGQSEKMLPKRVMCEIIESRVREIASFVKESIEQAGLSQLPKEGVALTGGGSLLNGIDKLFGEILGVNKVKVVEPRASGGHSREISNPSMSSAVGLARYALESSDDEYEPASGQTGWSQAVTTLKSLFGSRA
ncbi:MAG: cell division protein FtsA, partial [Armatimonadota bacterium]